MHSWRLRRVVHIHATGSNRLQRLQNFVSYLEQVFGPGKPQHLSLIPETVHVGGELPMMQMELGVGRVE